MKIVVADTGALISLGLVNQISEIRPFLLNGY